MLTSQRSKSMRNLAKIKHPKKTHVQPLIHSKKEDKGTLLQMIQLKKTSTPSKTYQDLKQKLDQRMFSRRASTARLKENRQDENSIKTRMLDLLKERQAVIEKNKKDKCQLQEMKEQLLKVQKLSTDLARREKQYLLELQMASADHESLLLQRVELACQFQELQEFIEVSDKTQQTYQNTCEMMLLQKKLNGSLKQNISESLTSVDINRKAAYGKIMNLTCQLTGIGKGIKGGLFQIVCNFCQMFLLQSKSGFKGQGQDCLLYVCQNNQVQRFFKFMLSQPSVTNNKKFKMFTTQIRSIMQQIESTQHDLTRGVVHVNADQNDKLEHEIQQIKEKGISQLIMNALTRLKSVEQGIEVNRDLLNQSKQLSQKLGERIKLAKESLSQCKAKRDLLRNKIRAEQKRQWQKFRIRQ